MCYCTLEFEFPVRNCTSEVWSFGPSRNDGESSRHFSGPPWGPTVAMRTMLVVPAMPSGTPATMITR